MKMAPGELSDDKNQKYLLKKNIPVLEKTNRPKKFSAFSNHAKHVATKNKEQNFTGRKRFASTTADVYTRNQESLYNPRAAGQSDVEIDPLNPYAVAAAAPPGSNPYADQGVEGNPYSRPDPMLLSQQRPRTNYQRESPSASVTTVNNSRDFGLAETSAEGLTTHLQHIPPLPQKHVSARATKYVPKAHLRPSPYETSYDDFEYGAEPAISGAASSASPSAGEAPNSYQCDAPAGQGSRSADIMSLRSVRTNGTQAAIEELNSLPHSDIEQGTVPQQVFGEPLVRTSTGTSTMVAREHLFGQRSAPVSRTRHFSPLDHVDELNERPGSLDELNALPDEDRSVFRSVEDEEVDELLMLPSDLKPQKKNNFNTGETNWNESNYVNEGNWEWKGENQDLEDSEDEEVEAIKSQIRYIKQETVNSTRNALRVAADAEIAGRNALGMLGAQGERIANTEQVVSIADSQTRIATRQADEISRLNRSIFIPNLHNPFNSKRRLHEREMKMRTQQAQDQLASERRRQLAYESEQRVLDALNQTSGTYSETALRHKKNMLKESEERKRVQFEADSEDDEIEDEIDLNLEGINDASKRLHTLGVSLQKELDQQNRRLEDLSLNTDKLDIDVHINSARMAAIK